MAVNRSSRRAFLRGAALMGGSLLLAACEPEIVQETVLVEKEVEKVVTEIVERTVEVEKVVTEIVERTVVVEKEKEPTPVEQVLVGAFDVGPHGCPQCYDPRKRSVYNWWMAKLWPPLALLDESGTKEIPELAESWEPIKDDGTAWRVKLREGLKWSDGEPLTTRDIYYSMHLTSNPVYTGVQAVVGGAGGRQIVGKYEYTIGEADEIVGIKVVDDVTIEFTYTEPYPLWSPSLINIEFAEHYWSQFETEEIAKGNLFYEPRPSNGPFMWSKYEKDQYTELVANPYYWRGKPKLDRLINRYFADETSAVLALQRGEIDLTYVSRDMTVLLQKVPGFSIIAGSSGVTNFINLNFRDPIVQDLRVRQAMMHAIDRDKIIETLYLGTARKVNSLFSQAEYNPPDLIDYPYDPDKARALLAEAGFKQDGALEVVTYYTDQLSTNVLQAIQAYWADVGIEMTPRVVDVPTFNSFHTLGKDWTMAYIGQSHSRGAEEAGRWNAESVNPNAVGECKDLHGCYPGIDEVTANIKVATTSMDAAVRLEATHDIARVMNAELCDLWMWCAERYCAVNDRVKNFRFAPLPAYFGFEDQSELWEIVS